MVKTMTMLKMGLLCILENERIEKLKELKKLD
jgi:hypothetical protein